VTKGHWEQPSIEEEEENDLTFEEQQEVQSVLKALARLLKNPAVEKYLKTALDVAWGPTMAAAVDKIIPKERQADTRKVYSVNDPQEN
jgi:pantoate kinase